MSTWYCFGCNQIIFGQSEKRQSAKYLQFDKLTDIVSAPSALTPFSFYFTVTLHVRIWLAAS